jgi:two-component sensor histidine kinase
MALLYDRLYRSPDFTRLSVKDYLPALIDEIMCNFPNSTMVKVDKLIQDFILDARRLQPLGIIINEIITNIMKYAFVGRKSGLITVSAIIAEGHVAISVADNGNGIPESVSFENSTGFGLQLIHGLSRQLKGIIRIERGNGTRILLEFPE